MALKCTKISIENPTGKLKREGGGQSPKNLVGVSALPTGKFLCVRKVFARIYKIGHKMKPELLVS